MGSGEFSSTVQRGDSLAQASEQALPMRIGILGAGQLGRMMALAGLPLGGRFTLLDPGGKPSAGIGDILSGDDDASVERFIDAVDVVTYEFEHLPAALLERIERQRPVYPSSRAIAVCQHRGEEKALFSRLAIPTPDYRLVESAEALEQAARELGGVVVAKSVTEGYDGKGQAVLKSPDQAHQAWARIGHAMLIVEAFVDFTRELSIIAVRGQGGEVRCYPIAENQHEEGILRYSMAPLADIDDALQARANGYIEALLAELDYVGVLSLELFQTRDGELWANEMAPRVHNSGHWTQNGAVTSQFENHLRAVCGLPLGDTAARGLSCMVNVIGEEGDPAALLALEGVHLHRYDKAPRAGRKLAHVNVVADDYDTLLARVDAVTALLPNAFAVKMSHRQ